MRGKHVVTLVAALCLAGAVVHVSSRRSINADQTSVPVQSSLQSKPVVGEDPAPPPQGAAPGELLAKDDGPAPQGAAPGELLTAADTRLPGRPPPDGAPPTEFLATKNLAANSVLYPQTALDSK